MAQPDRPGAGDGRVRETSFPHTCRINLSRPLYEVLPETMISNLQPGRNRPGFALWMRLAALLALLLILAGSTVQAGHAHGGWLPRHGTQADAWLGSSDLPANEANCQICVAMHSACATAAEHQVQVVSTALCRLPRFCGSVRTRPLGFSLFGRPPPVALYS